MLRKLLKYEIKATARIFLPLYALLLVFAGVNRVFMEVNSSYLNIPQALTSIAYGFILFGTFIITIIMTVQRFYKNLLGDEGYLMFTLPVKTSLHIWSKFLTSFLWSVLSVFAAIISMFILGAKGGTFLRLGEFFAKLFEEMNKLGSSAWIIFFETLLIILVGSVFAIMQIYAAIVIGNLSSKHKLLAGFGVYIGLGMVVQFVVSLLFVQFGPRLSQYAEKFSLNSHYTPPQSEVLQMAQSIFAVIILFFLVFGSLYFILTNMILKKRLNLE